MMKVLGSIRFPDALVVLSMIFIGSLASGRNVSFIDFSYIYFILSLMIKAKFILFFGIISVLAVVSALLAVINGNPDIEQVMYVMQISYALVGGAALYGYYYYRSAVPRLYALMFSGLIINCIVGCIGYVYLKFTGSESLLWFSLGYATQRLTSDILIPNDLAILFLSSLVMLLASKTRGFSLWGAAFVICFLSILATFSRSGLMAFVLFGLIYYMMSGRVGKLGLTAFGIILILFLGIYVWPMVSDLNSIQRLVINPFEKSDESRLTYLAHFLDGVAGRMLSPALGFEDGFAAASSVHNYYLSIIYNFGISGLLIVSSLLAALVYVTLHDRWKLGFFALMVCFSLNPLMTHRAIMLVFFLPLYMAYYSSSYLFLLRPRQEGARLK